jgi:hypothetical protein
MVLTLLDATNKEMVDECFRDKSDDLPAGQPLGLERTAKSAVHVMEYTSNLFTGGYSGDNPNRTLDSKCNGKLGNKFLTEYGKCKEGNELKKTYKIVDNTCDYGLIGCVFGQVGDVAKSTNGLFKSIFSFEQPVCNTGRVKKQSNINLHVKKGDRMVTGNLNTPVYIVEDFENLYNNVITDLKENNNLNEINELYEFNKNKIINNDFISETYYVLLILFLLFLTYKISNKK